MDSFLTTLIIVFKFHYTIERVVKFSWTGGIQPMIVDYIEDPIKKISFAGIQGKISIKQRISRHFIIFRL